jgi:hypothetical protein
MRYSSGRLYYETMITKGSTTMGSVKVLMLSSGKTLTLFAQASTQVLNHDASLSWSLDSQTVVLKSLGLPSLQIMMYSATLSSPTTMQIYTTKDMASSSDNHEVHMIWQGDGGVFAICSSQQGHLSSGVNVYKFRVGQPNGTLLLANALNFTWG